MLSLFAPLVLNVLLSNDISSSHTAPLANVQLVRQVGIVLKFIRMQSKTLHLLTNTLIHQKDSEHATSRVPGGAGHDKASEVIAPRGDTILESESAFGNE